MYTYVFIGCINICNNHKDRYVGGKENAKDMYTMYRGLKLLKYVYIL